jgi:hypothetical protein
VPDVMRYWDILLRIIKTRHIIKAFRLVLLPDVMRCYHQCILSQMVCHYDTFYEFFYHRHYILLNEFFCWDLNLDSLHDKQA